MMSLKNTLFPLFPSNPFPVSSKPQTLHFPHKKTHFHIQVTKHEWLVARKRDEAEQFYKTLHGKTKEERKKALEDWIEKERKKFKDVKKWDPIVLGNVIGRDKWSIIKWMLICIGIYDKDEEIELKEEKIKIKEEKMNAKEEVVKTKEEEAKEEDDEEMKEQKEVEEKKKEVEDLLVGGNGVGKH